MWWWAATCPQLRGLNVDRHGDGRELSVGASVPGVLVPEVVGGFRSEPSSGSLPVTARYDTQGVNRLTPIGSGEARDCCLGHSLILW